MVVGRHLLKKVVDRVIVVSVLRFAKHSSCCYQIAFRRALEGRYPVVAIYRESCVSLALLMTA